MPSVLKLTLQELSQHRKANVLTMSSFFTFDSDYLRPQESNMEVSYITINFCLVSTLRKESNDYSLAWPGR